jgi:urease beta subunit
VRLQVVRFLGGCAAALEASQEVAGVGWLLDVQAAQALRFDPSAGTYLNLCAFSTN